MLRVPKQSKAKQSKAKQRARHGCGCNCSTFVFSLYQFSSTGTNGYTVDTCRFLCPVPFLFSFPLTHSFIYSFAHALRTLSLSPRSFTHTPFTSSSPSLHSDTLRSPHQTTSNHFPSPIAASSPSAALWTCLWTVSPFSRQSRL
jgi:hypothetical protein